MHCRLKAEGGDALRSGNMLALRLERQSFVKLLSVEYRRRRTLDCRPHCVAAREKRHLTAPVVIARRHSRCRARENCNLMAGA